MSAYILVLIWVISNVVCVYLVRKRNLEPGVTLRVIGAILGPFAIPLIFTLKPKPTGSTATLEEV